MTRFSKNIVGIKDIFLLFKKIFDRDQYTLKFFWVFISLFTVFLATSLEAFRQA